MKDRLIELVIVQVKKDIKDNNTEALQELLSSLDNENLVAYLPE